MGCRLHFIFCLPQDGKDCLRMVGWSQCRLEGRSSTMLPPPGHIASLSPLGPYVLRLPSAQEQTGPCACQGYMVPWHAAVASGGKCMHPPRASALFLTLHAGAGGALQAAKGTPYTVVYFYNRQQFQNSPKSLRRGQAAFPSFGSLIVPINKPFKANLGSVQIAWSLAGSGGTTQYRSCSRVLFCAEFTCTVGARLYVKPSRAPYTTYEP